jgi:hypothetical protein
MDPLVDHAAGGVLPAFVLGWDTISSHAEPPFILEVGHQFGGYACLQTIVSGLVLPLHENRDRALRDPSLLLEGFRSIAESQQGSVPSRPPRSACPLVDAWGYTSGEPMTPPDLCEWNALLGAYYELPPLSSGAEGLLVFAPERVPSFVGWRALMMTASGALRTFSVDGTTLSRLGESRPTLAPCLFLLWESSD